MHKTRDELENVDVQLMEVTRDVGMLDPYDDFAGIGFDDVDAMSDFVDMDFTLVDE
jgi:hypothetical protein